MPNDESRRSSAERVTEKTFVFPFGEKTSPIVAQIQMEQYHCRNTAFQKKSEKQNTRTYAWKTKNGVVIPIYLPVENRCACWAPNICFATSVCAEMLNWKKKTSEQNVASSKRFIHIRCRCDSSVQRADSYTGIKTLTREWFDSSPFTGNAHMI